MKRTMMTLTVLMLALFAFSAMAQETDRGDDGPYALKSTAELSYRTIDSRDIDRNPDGSDVPDQRPDNPSLPDEKPSIETDLVAVDGEDTTAYELTPADELAMDLDCGEGKWGLVFEDDELTGYYCED